MSVKQTRNVTWNSRLLTLPPDNLILASYSQIKIRQNLKQLKCLASNDLGISQKYTAKFRTARASFTDSVQLTLFT